MEAKEREKEEAIREQQEILAQIKQNEELARAEDAERVARQHAFGKDLRAQLAYNEGLREAERQEHERELASYKQAEVEYEARLQRVLAKELAERTHPFKRALQAEARQAGGSTFASMPYVPSYASAAAGGTRSPSGLSHTSNSVRTPQEAIPPIKSFGGTA